ncbi:MAG: PIN domain-containing protein [Ancrocorticia sp.]|uniref:PIN domain-containing protein n=1 Tax=Ancrocorticia sp. TaxID=2593684 RepID=UPI003F8F3B0C
MNALIAFDSDALIYAAVPGHALGQHVFELFGNDEDYAGIGSVLLLPEILTKPLRDDPESQEVELLAGLLGRLRLIAFDQTVAQLSVGLATKYGLRAADAAHLATAVFAGADLFITNNRKDFPKRISEIDIVYPDELPAVLQN